MNLQLNWAIFASLFCSLKLFGVVATRFRVCVEEQILRSAQISFFLASRFNREEIIIALT